MRVFDHFRKADLPKTIAGQGVLLRFPTLEDYAAWADLRRASRRFLEPWEPSWAPDELTPSGYRYRIRRYRELAVADQCYPYFIFAADDVLLGAVTLNNVRRGVAQTATLGYWIGENHARKGHMTRAVTALVDHAAGTLGLHRIEAACLPRNEASIRLLQATGFEREGYARSYLRIAGQWEDHLLFAHVAAPQ